MVLFGYMTYFGLATSLQHDQASRRNHSPVGCHYKNPPSTRMVANVPVVVDFQKNGEGGHSQLACR